MIIVYVGEEPPATFSKSLFLAGPTPRSLEVASWRPSALKILEDLQYDGVVFIPERREGNYEKGEYVDQVEWEDSHLNMSDAVPFWVPRRMETMPALTTNIEWGVWCNSGKVIFGAPADAEHVRYQQHYAKKYYVPTADTLKTTLEAALIKIGEGTVRSDGERNIPLFIWRTPAFQKWYSAQKAVGNRLDGARVLWSFRTGPNKLHLFMWIIHVNVHVTSENRNKINEIIIGRPDTSAIVMYRRRDPLVESEIALIREFRSTVSNDSGFVWETPGGSSFKPNCDPLTTAAEECAEEAGIKLDPQRFRAHQIRQVAATSLTHRSHLFSVELTEEELDALKNDHGNVHGLAHDGGERTFVEVVTLREIMERQVVDWSMLGMIMSVLHSR